MPAKKGGKAPCAEWLAWDAMRVRIEGARDKTLAVPSMHGPRWDHSMKLHYEKMLRQHGEREPAKFGV